MQQSLEIIRRRVDETGTREPSIQRQGADRILVQVPGIGSAEELLQIIGKTARLSLPPGGQPHHRRQRRGRASTQEMLPSMDEQGVYYVLEKRAVVTGEQLGGQPALLRPERPAGGDLPLQPVGRRRLRRSTPAENIGKPFAIVLDNEVISAPVIQAHIAGGSGIITGNFTPEESTRLAILLRAGALPAEIKVLEQRTIGPELGQDSIDAGAMSAVVALVAVVVFMVASYGWFGWIADRRRWCMNLILIFALMTADRGDADHARHRRHRADHRHGGGRQRADLRAHPRGAEDRARAGAGDRARLREGVLARSSTPTSPR